MSAEQAAISARAPLSRLRKGASSRPAPRGGMVDALAIAVPAAIGVVVLIGAIRPLGSLFTEPGWAVPGAPGQLFTAAALLLLWGVIALILRSAGPITASSAFWFWLLSAPVRRRDLLRRRYFGLITTVCLAAFVVASLVAHAGSVPVLPEAATAGLASIALTGGSVCGQAWDGADRVMHAIGQALCTVGVVAFGSLATGVGRVNLNSILLVSPIVATILLAALAVAAIFSCVLGYRGLDRIDVSVLRRGQGLWTSGHLAAVSMDVFTLTDFLADQRARQTGRIRPARIGTGYISSLVRSEWARLRRRPYFAVHVVVAGLMWWGCRPVLVSPLLASIAVIVGYFLVLPVAGTLRQLTANPALRTQFAPRDRLLTLASLMMCLLASAGWAAIVVPGLHGGAALAILITFGLTAAVYRTVTRPPLDYTWPLVPTPAGDFPLDLWRQMFRGILLLAVVIAATVALAIH